MYLSSGYPASVKGGTVIAVRPERIALADAAPEGDQNALRGEVFETAYHGSGLSVHLRVCDGRETLVARSQIGQIDPARIRIGATLWCVWAPEHTRILKDA